LVYWRTETDPPKMCLLKVEQEGFLLRCMI
jgi:hypothetical protein